MSQQSELVNDARNAAHYILLHNLHGPFKKLPRTAGWGYPEPYTRDLMISALGFLVSGEPRFIKMTERVLKTAAVNQTSRGHIPSLIHDPEDRGASDTTPLFLLAVAAYRLTTGESDFLEDAVRRSLTWMDYQSPGDRVMVAQLPTSDWRDEQWVLGFGLFVNTVVYAYLKLHGEQEKADVLRGFMTRFTLNSAGPGRHRVEGVAIKETPYYALWSYKIYSSERFDLLGNSLAILTGLAGSSRARRIIDWVEQECSAMQRDGLLNVGLPPNFFPFINPGDADWLPRYDRFNRPGDYHNGGIWPFICGFYLAALVAAKQYDLAERKLELLAALLRQARDHDVEFGFNEYYKAQTGNASGQDWQTWSAAMFLYAEHCVRTRSTPFFDEVRR